MVAVAEALRREFTSASESAHNVTLLTKLQRADLIGPSDQRHHYSSHHWNLPRYLPQVPQRRVGKGYLRVPSLPYFWQGY